MVKCIDDCLSGRIMAHFNTLFENSKILFVIDFQSSIADNEIKNLTFYEYEFWFNLTLPSLPPSGQSDLRYLASECQNQ